MWSEFVNTHLHDVLRNALSDIASAADKQPFAALETIKEDRCEEAEEDFCSSLQDFVDMDGG
jgi:hypothetical protein